MTFARHCGEFLGAPFHATATHSDITAKRHLALSVERISFPGFRSLDLREQVLHITKPYDDLARIAEEREARE